MSKDEMGERMKGYERVTDTRLDTSLPIIARIDGRSFSSFTRGYHKPFDFRISNAMWETCKYLVEETHAKIGYVQSDEITLVFYNDNPQGSVFFDGRVLKLTSVLASMAGVKFHSVFGGDKLPSFDCRVWNVPSKMEAANTVLWRVFDCRKNAVSVIAQSVFSPKELFKKNQADMWEMLAKVGIDYDTYHPDYMEGIFFQRVVKKVEIDQETWDKIPDSKKPVSRKVLRSFVEQVDMPFFGDVRNRVEVIFDGEEPDDSPDPEAIRRHNEWFEKKYANTHFVVIDEVVPMTEEEVKRWSKAAKELKDMKKIMDYRYETD